VTAVLLLVGLGVAAVWSNGRRDRADAEKALAEARGRFDRGEFADAATTLDAALDQARERHLTGELPRDLETLRFRAERGQAAAELHRLADNLRFWADPETLPASQRPPLEAACRAVWSRRDRLTDARGGPLPGDREEQLRTDLLDLALLWAELHARSDDLAARPEALRVLAEAEALSGPVAAIARVRANLGRAPDAAPAIPNHLDRPNATAWEHYALGRAMMHAGSLEEAGEEFSRAVRLQPTGFWPTFYQGICLYRSGTASRDSTKLTNALIALSYCIDRARQTPECYYNRALVFESLSKLGQNPNGNLKSALEDYAKALELEPNLGVAHLNRGIIRLSRNEFANAERDFTAALAGNAPTAVVHYNFAVLAYRQQRTDEARAHLKTALRADPKHAEASALLANLSKQQPPIR
jgi:tetratricopeptide (TPR) repeat protein